MRGRRRVLTIDASTSSGPESGPPKARCSPRRIDLRRVAKENKKSAELLHNRTESQRRETKTHPAPFPFFTHHNPPSPANANGASPIVHQNKLLFSPPTYCPVHTCFFPLSGRLPPSHDEKGIRRTLVRSYQKPSSEEGHCSSSVESGERGVARGKSTQSPEESRW